MDYELVSEGELSGGAEEAEMSAVIRDEEPSADEDWFRGGEFSCERAEQEGRRAAALDVMNDFPFWRGEHPFRQTLAPFYEHAAVYACEILTGGKEKTGWQTAKTDINMVPGAWSLHVYQCP